MTDQELRDLVAENSLAIKQMREENRQRDREWNANFEKREKRMAHKIRQRSERKRESQS